MSAPCSTHPDADDVASQIQTMPHKNSIPSELLSRTRASFLPAAEEIEVELSGIFVPTDRPQPVGSIVTLALKLHASETPLKTLARVAYVVDASHPDAERGMGMGLTFVDVWGSRASEQVTHYLHEVAFSEKPAPLWSSGLTVLVVDDDDKYREHAASVMREGGFEVLTAQNGFEALSLVLKHQPNLVLTDVTMPNMDGWQLLRLIRARPTLRRTPVMFLTALSNDNDRLRGYQLGVDDYVAKPFTSVELTARVERVLERANAADEAVANGMRGDLAKVPVTSLLSLVEMERRSGVLQLVRPGEKATLHLRDGAVIRIDLCEPHDRLEGLARFFFVLDWQAGRFDFSAIEVFGDDQIDTPISFALLEHARRDDEESR